MTKFTVQAILNHLVRTFPKPQNIIDFSIPKEDEQDFMNFLLELNHRGFIDALFHLSAMRESYGLPIAVEHILISKNGREFLEAKEPESSITQNISITNVSGKLNIAGRDINNNNGADANKLLEILLKNIETSNLPAEERKSLAASFKSMLSSTAGTVITNVLVESVKALFL